ncbi:MAG: type 4a pilus biogenesis protein PilO [Planctomycetota bacterium]
MKLKLSEKQLLILTIIIPAVIAVILGVVGYFVFSKKLSLLTKNINETSTKITEAKDRSVKMEELEGRLSKLRKEQDELEALMPTKEEISYENFIDTLTKLSREANIYLSSAIPEQNRGIQPSIQSSLFDKISYRLSITGDFFQVIYYIYLLETYQRFIKVDRFSVKPITESTNNKLIRYSLDLTLTTYVYNKPQTKK